MTRTKEENAADLALEETKPRKIEVALAVEGSLLVGFWIEPDKWDAMDDEAKRKAIGDHIDLASIHFSNGDVIHLFDDDKTFISAGIHGPDNDKINLEQVQIYDPDK